MSHDVECPYCNHEQEICHDDGYGFDENVMHEQTCYNCEKDFVYTTFISFSYNTYKADCLNDGNHKLKPSNTAPKWATQMVCSDCDFRRSPTDAERKEFNIPKYIEATNEK